jgi:hypothetical protein
VSSGIVLEVDGADASVMSGLLLMAAVYPAELRLLVAVAVFLVYVAMLPRPAPRPLAAATLCAIVVVWDFGATLIWGTAGPSKVRFDFVLGAAGGLALLACAIASIVAAAGALRLFAHGKTRAGTILAGVFGVGLAGWSAAVRYSPFIAAIGLLAGSVALWWAATMPADHAPALVEKPRTLLLRALPPVVMPCMSGFLFYAYLKWGPTSWADPGCGASLVIPVFFGAVGVSALAVWRTSRAAGRRTEAVAATAVIAALLAAGICVVAFLLWFGQNHCGE